MNQDPIEQWLSECCTRQCDAWTANASIMASYTKWCADHGYETKKAKGLAQSLATYGFEISVLNWVKDATGKRAKVRGVRGLSLIEDVVRFPLHGDSL
jgi:phage/plasmid-associated DNA primase